MEILAKRGQATFIVKLAKNKYYLVSVGDSYENTKPLESDTPDTFLRAGYFYDWEENAAEAESVKTTLTKWGIL